MTSTTIGSKDLIRALNRSIILNAIKSRGPIGRADVARMTGLSPATVTGITGDLIEEGLVFEKEQGESNRGRPPILLAINPRGGFVIGIKLMEEHAIGALTDLEATVIAKAEEPFHGTAAESALDALDRLVTKLLEDGGIARDRLLGVGVGLAGIVDSTNGLLRQSPFFGWRDLPLRDMIHARVRTPVFIDNDVNTLTQAEHLFGSGQGVDHFLTLTIGRGIGLGVVLNGQFYRGAGGGAGEFGHITIDPSGPLCDCGRRGCLETYTADPALLRIAAEAHRAGTLPAVASTDELLALAEAGDAAAQAIFAHAGELLGGAVANLINVLNPERILVSGEGARYGRWIFDPLQAAIRDNALPALLADVEIRLDPWGDDVWARGAASLVLRQLFGSPIAQLAASTECD